MNENPINRIFNAKIKLKDIKEDIISINNNPDARVKKIAIKRILGLSNNFNDSIDFFIKNDEIILYWKKPKINEKAEKIHITALQYARKGDLANSIKNWEEAVQIDPYHPDYFFNLGIAYFEQKKYVEAINALTRTLSICPIFYKAYLILGTSYLKLRKFENSKLQFEKYLIYDKTNSLVYLNLGTVHSILKEYKSGLLMFEKVNELNPKEPKAYLGLAKINLSLGKIDEANEYFKKVIDVDKNGTLANYAKRSITIAKRPLMANGNLTANYEKPEEYYSEGYRSYLINNFPKSIEMYKNYLMIKPDDDYVWCALGESYLRSGEIKAAIETFKKAAKISPQKALYYKELAIAFFYIDDFEKVVIAASKAKELGKADSVTYCIWGKSLLEKGNINEAIIMLDHSLRSNKNNLLAKYYLAEALAKNDDYLNAAGYLDEIISIKNSTPLKDKALELKKSLKER